MGLAKPWLGVLSITPMMPSRLFPHLATTTAALLLAFTGSARGQAWLSFSGGSGTPLTLTLAQPVTYVTTTNVGAGFAPYFAFDEVGNAFGMSYPTVTGTMTFQVNGGAAQSLTQINSGWPGGPMITPNDWYLLTPSLPAMPIGSIVTLLPGSMTTTVPVAAAAPAAGAYNTYLTSVTATQVSDPGTAVPEPGSALLLACGALGILTRRRRAQG